MAEATTGRHRHFILEGVTETEEYRRPGSGGHPPLVPEQDRVRHGGRLLRQLEQRRKDADDARNIQLQTGLEEGLGLQIEFESFPDVDLAFESLARGRQGIELLNVRHEEKTTFATVFVPDGKLAHFERLIEDYLGEKRDRAGRRRDNRRLIDAIRRIRAASIRALWTDAGEAFPTADEGAVWWEVSVAGLVIEVQCTETFGRALRQTSRIAVPSQSIPRQVGGRLGLRWSGTTRRPAMP